MNVDFSICKYKLIKSKLGVRHSIFRNQKLSVKTAQFQ